MADYERIYRIHLTVDDGGGVTLFNRSTIPGAQYERMWSRTLYYRDGGSNSLVLSEELGTFPDLLIIRNSVSVSFTTTSGSVLLAPGYHILHETLVAPTFEVSAGQYGEIEITALKKV